MIEYLLIGGRGIIGSALRNALDQQTRLWSYTTRLPGDGIFFDLAETSARTLPNAQVVFIVAGKAGFAICQSREAWLANVDGPIRIARRYRDAFIVYLSSEAVEFCGGTELARHKAQVEAALALRENVAIVRPSRVTLEHADEFASFLVSLGNRREAGLHRWKGN